MFGLPDVVTACLFDMDGVVTKTAVVHAAAWKAMFDEFLEARAQADGTPFVPFDSHSDYDRLRRRQAPDGRHQVVPAVPEYRAARGPAG